MEKWKEVGVNVWSKYIVYFPQTAPKIIKREGGKVHKQNYRNLESVQCLWTWRERRSQPSGGLERKEGRRERETQIEKREDETYAPGSPRG